MKKGSLFLLAGLFAMSLTACTAKKNPRADLTLSQVASAIGNGDAFSDKSDSSQTDGATALAVQEKKPAPFDTSGVIEETVLYEQDGVKITATKLSYTQDGAVLEILAENNTEGRRNFFCGTGNKTANAVNGYMTVDGSFSEFVEAGAKKNLRMEFGFKELQSYGINAIGSISFTMGMQDEGFQESVMPPFQIKTQIADEIDESQELFLDAVRNASSLNAYGVTVKNVLPESLFDNGRIKNTCAVLAQNPDGEETLFIEFQNISETTLDVDFGDIAINGVLFHSSYWSGVSILPGKYVVQQIPLHFISEEFRKDILGIKEVENVAMSVNTIDPAIGGRGESGFFDMVFSTTTDEIDMSGQEIYNANGLRLVYKALLPDPNPHVKSFHIYILADNVSGEPRSIGDLYDVFTVNGISMNRFIATKDLRAGQKGVIDIEVSHYSLEDNAITDLEQIQNAEVQLRLYREATTLDEVRLFLEF